MAVSLFGDHNISTLTETQRCDGGVGPKVCELVGMKSDALLPAFVAIGSGNIGTPYLPFSPCTTPFQRKPFSFSHFIIDDLLNIAARFFHSVSKDGRRVCFASVVPVNSR